jgi:DNA polymerase-3 subunit beta
LECILFELEGNTLKMTASDSETTLVTTMDVEETDGSGKFAIKAATIINGLKEFYEQPITIEVNLETYEVKVTYQNGKSSFIGQTADEYPLPVGIDDGVQALNIDSQVLSGGLSRALFATADDELRPVMNGVFFDLSEEYITFVASDGHKLVRDRNSSVKAPQPSSFILPKKPAKTLKDILSKEEGEAEIRFDDKNAEIKVGSYVLVCRLIVGRYPNYNSVIPTDNPYHVTIDRESLIGALKRTMVFANTSTSLIKLHLENNSLTVSTQDIDYSSSAEEHIMCDYTGNPMSIGFKGTFLLDIINGMDSQDIVLQLADPSRAGVIVPAEQAENEDLLMLLMPMMLNE